MNDYEERGRRRALMAFRGLQEWRKQNGVPQLEHVLLAAFSGIAEVHGVWAFLVDKGIATEAERQDYLDKGWKLFLDQQSATASKIFIAEAGRG